jgi:GNAT superfamily N-acetyltransferase
MFYAADEVRAFLHQHTARGDAMEARMTFSTHSRDEIAAAMEQNMVGHMSYAAARMEEASVSADCCLICVDSGLPTDTFNVVCGANLERDQAEARIQSTIDWFRERGQPFSWWIGPSSNPTDLPERLQHHGLVHAEDEAGMICNLTTLDTNPVPIPGIEIRQVRGPEQLHQLAQTVATNWDPPDRHVISFYDRSASIVLASDSPLRFWLAYSGDQPVAACETYLGNGVAGLYAVVTRQPFRGRGIGTALIHTALLRACADGYGVATLQASGQAQRIYERLGFETWGVFREFKPAWSF